MHRMPFHIDCTERPCRAEVLARSAADAPLGIDSRNPYRIHIITVGRDHKYRPGRTVTGTVAAFYTICQRNAVLPYPDCMTDTCGRLLLNSYRSDGTCRADIRAACTFRTDRIAVCTSVTSCQHYNHHKSYGSNDKCREALHPDLCPIKGIAVSTCGKICKQIVSPAIYRGE